MSVSGLCEVCQRPDVDHTCDRCGNLVCDRHFDTQLGICSECVAEVEGGDPTDPTGTGDDTPDGVDTYRF
ncbi:hypothetical protein [Halosimplex halobium]|uniref:hypothetical protein n=1 Tax=Halosimplex halobium TaxID=3396618 RepID=UPI003F573BE1